MLKLNVNDCNRAAGAPSALALSNRCQAVPFKPDAHFEGAWLYIKLPTLRPPFSHPSALQSLRSVAIEADKSASMLFQAILNHSYAATSNHLVTAAWWLSKTQLQHSIRLWGYESDMRSLGVIEITQTGSCHVGSEHSTTRCRPVIPPREVSAHREGGGGSGRPTRSAPQGIPRVLSPGAFTRNLASAAGPSSDVLRVAARG